MSRTLFRYIFLDLVKVFILACAALAGIMSFGGLLRPLTQHGLDGWQVLKILACLILAMSSYSLPIAALFATTVVYGRLAADNELIACRASGISHLAISLPGLLLGILVAIIAMALLCFIVPLASLQVEKTIYSNVARIIATQIDRSHVIKFGKFAVFAQGATIPPREQVGPDEQIVVLSGPMIVRFDKADPARNTRRAPREFLMARQATLHIRSAGDNGRIMMEAVLDDGAKFPRIFEHGVQAGIESTQFGPVELQSGMGEKSKFMTIFQLKDLDQDPTRSRAVREIVNEFIQDEQVANYARQIAGALNGLDHSAIFSAPNGTFTLKSGMTPPVIKSGEITITADRELEDRPIRLSEIHGDRTVMAISANRAHFALRADSDSHRIIVSVELYDCILEEGGSQTPRSSFPARFSVAMTDDLRSIEKRGFTSYLADTDRTSDQHQKLMHTWIQQTNSIRGEMHARASFSVSCLILVMIGATMGMMFKSGNFLNAFAITVVPAVLTVVLIVSGQHIVEGVPLSVTALTNPLQTGLALIWCGNAAVLIIGTVLLWRLHRQ